MTKKLTEHTFARGGVVPAGQPVWLTAEQMAPRRHQLDAAPDAKPRNKRAAVIGRGPLYFKAGEVVAFDGAIPRTVEAVLQSGDVPADDGAETGADDGAAEATRAAERKAEAAVREAETKAANEIAAAVQAKAEIEKELAALRDELGRIGDDLVAAEAKFIEAKQALDALAGDAPEAARAEAEAAVETANEQLALVEDAVAVFAKRFATAPDAEKEDGTDA